MDEQLLFDRIHAALDTEPRAGAYDRLRAALTASGPQAPRRPRFSFRFPVDFSRPVSFLLAMVLLAAVAVAAIGGFIAINQYVHRAVPVRVPPVVPASGTCSYGFHMVTEATGWQGPTSRSTDGGTTWKEATSLPTIPDETKGGFGSCTLGGLHAWMTVAVATPQSIANKNAPPQADHLLVLITVDGGQTWTEGGSVPASGLNAGATIEFITDQKGWLLVDTDTRVLYGTTDGGYHWSRLSAPGTLDKFTGPCLETGMTFASAERGWITWDCTASRGSGPTGDGSSVVAVTVDGGRTWARPALPSYIPTGETCTAAPPVFTASKGVLAIACPGGGPTSWRGVYRTDDLGASWVLGSAPPSFFQLSQIDFVDASVGFAFTGAGDDLYRTVDSGQSWSLVKSGVFRGQQIEMFQFLSPTTGLVYTSTSQGRPWKTNDGGQTWSLNGVRSLPGNVGCPAAWSPAAGAAPVPILMSSNATGWASGAQRTVDGGLHWTTSGPPTPDLPSNGRVEFFLDKLHAWVAVAAGSAGACADHVLVFATADGGSTWRQMSSLPVSIGSPGDQVWGGGFSASPRSASGHNGPYLYFADTTHGWMIVTVGRPDFFMGARSKTLYRTDDGGATWLKLSGPELESCSSDEVGIVFSTATTGWMPAYACGATDSLAVYVTRDAGDSWALQTIGPACGCSGNVPMFLDPAHGVLLQGAPGPILVVTSDGGGKWANRTVPPDADAYGASATYSFADPSHGWILFSESSNNTTRFPLYRTTDGGRSWTQVAAAAIPPQDNYKTAASMYFVDSNIGFIAVGGQLYRTADGGRTWSVILTVSA